MTDVAHVPRERLQLSSGHSLAEVFASALKEGGAKGEPPTSEPRGSDDVRTPEELQAVIDEAGIEYADCGGLSVLLDWWNRNSDDSDWQVVAKGASKPTG
ncbi:MAG: hypothetical protein WDO69_34660 [Pseudomonadota bacterium]